MATVGDISAYLQKFAPLNLAGDWDNVGLLVGDTALTVQRVMACLTITPQTCAEAIERQANLIVSHHPVLFRAVRSLTTSTVEGKMILDLVRAGVAVFSPHTAFDNTTGGINEHLAKELGLSEVVGLRKPKNVSVPHPGEGRIGKLPQPASLAEVISRVKVALNCGQLQIVGDLRKPIRIVAIACGAGGDFTSDARHAGADLFMTGEMRFHDCLAADAAGMAVCLPGHFATERIGIEMLAKQMKKDFSAVEIWASEREVDPIAFH